MTESFLSISPMLSHFSNWLGYSSHMGELLRQYVDIHCYPIVISLIPGICRIGSGAPLHTTLLPIQKQHCWELNACRQSLRSAGYVLWAEQTNHK